MTAIERVEALASGLSKKGQLSLETFHRKFSFLQLTGINKK